MRLKLVQMAVEVAPDIMQVATPVALIAKSEIPYGSFWATLFKIPNDIRKIARNIREIVNRVPCPHFLSKIAGGINVGI